MLFKLDDRLAACAELVRSGTKLADIGTDHAYLPVWLTKNGKISSAIAADINPKPLERGLENIKRYSAEDIVTTRLSNGLQNIKPDEADDIVIAGMGAELIIDIVSKAEWLENGGKRLILQPMTRAYMLRRYLYENGFEIKAEIACEQNGKVYSVIMAEYSGAPVITEELEEYIGKLDMNLTISKKYGLQVLKKLADRREGLKHTGKDTSSIDKIIHKLNVRCKNG